MTDLFVPYPKVNSQVLIAALKITLAEHPDFDVDEALRLAQWILRHPAFVEALRLAVHSHVAVDRIRLMEAISETISIPDLGGGS